jgi:hypothetical protein
MRRIILPDDNINTLLSRDAALWLHHGILLGIIAENLSNRK